MKKNKIAEDLFTGVLFMVAYRWIFRDDLSILICFVVTLGSVILSILLADKSYEYLLRKLRENGGGKTIWFGSIFVNLWIIEGERKIAVQIGKIDIQ